jgi:hypothetical protein
MMMASAAAVAHDLSDADAAWYRSLTNGKHEYCCSPQRDCEEVDDYRPSSEPGGYEALWRGQWVRIPASAVLDRSDNPTGHAVMCAWSGGDYGNQPVVRCFVRATEG